MDQTYGEFVEQVIRPTGLIDPICKVKPATSQIDDIIGECKKTIKEGYRCLITVLTKKMAEDLTEYMNDLGLKVQYMHSDIDTLERVEILYELKEGAIDVLGLAYRTINNGSNSDIIIQPIGRNEYLQIPDKSYYQIFSGLVHPQDCQNSRYHILIFFLNL